MNVLGKDSPKATARWAGVLYLLLALAGIYSDMYVPSAIMVPGDAAATARNITANELTYRLGIVGGLLAHLLFLLLVLTLYTLLKDVDQKQARLMLVLVCVGVAVGLANLLNRVAPLVLLSGADYLSVFTKPELDTLALGFLRMRGTASYVVSAFWGLWLLPFGILVIKSRFFPKVLGILLIVGCFSYLTMSITGLVFPALTQLVSRVTLPFSLIGEVSMIFWLLIKGARVPPGLRRPEWVLSRPRL